MTNLKYDVDLKFTGLKEEDKGFDYEISFVFFSNFLKIRIRGEHILRWSQVCEYNGQGFSKKLTKSSEILRKCLSISGGQILDKSKSKNITYF